MVFDRSHGYVWIDFTHNLVLLFRPRPLNIEEVWGMFPRTGYWCFYATKYVRDLCMVGLIGEFSSNITGSVNTAYSEKAQ